MKIVYILILFSLFKCVNAQLPAYVPSNGLQGFWPFCNNAIDVSGHGHHGTVSGAVLTADRFNVSARAYNFNGNLDYISTTMTGILGNNPRAVSFWAKTSESMNVMCGVSWGDEQSNPNYGVRYECAFNYVATGATFIGSDCAITYSTPAAINDNNWHHYVYQYNTGADITFVQVYQDGILLNNTLHLHNPNAPVNTSNNWPVNFGRIPYMAPHSFNGSLDEIGIWNRVLTSAEILQLFNGNGTCGSVNVSLDEEDAIKDDLSIYPNPNTGSFNVKVAQSTNISLMNALGQIVFKTALSADAPFEVAELAPGIYVLRGETETEQWQKKIIVSK